jgi:hypothetical protein
MKGQAMTHWARTCWGRGAASDARVFATLVAGIALMLLGTGDALAVDCVTEEALSAPRDGATDVPLNTVIWSGLDFRHVVLFGPDGEVATERRLVPMAVYARRDSGLPVYIPVEPLLPNTTYTVEEDGRAHLTRQFTTGSEIDDLPPSPVVLTRSDAIPGRLTLDFAVEGILAGELEPASAAFAAIDDVLLPQNFEYGYFAIDADKPIFQWLTETPQLSLQSGSVCSNWAREYAVSARFGAFDLAGNFSGWSDVPDLEVPPRPPMPASGVTPAWVEPEARSRAGGCAMGATAHAPRSWAAWFGLSLLTLLRAARPSRPRTSPSSI